MFIKKLAIFIFASLMVVGMNRTIDAEAAPILNDPIIDLTDSQVGVSASPSTSRTYTVEYTARKIDKEDFKIDPIELEFDKDIHLVPGRPYAAPVGYYFSNWSTVDTSNTSYTYGGTTLYAGMRYMNIAFPGQSKVFYPVWNPIAYYLNFNPNGGTGHMYPQTLIYNRNDMVNKELFTREGYKFIGWSTDPNSANPEFQPRAKLPNLTTRAGDTIQFYAIWEKEEEQNYTIKYDSNVEDLSTVSGQMDDSIVPIDTDFSILSSNYNREGYTFSHWTKTRVDNENDRLYPGYKVKNLGSTGEIVTLYAQWTPIHYASKYNDTETSGFSNKHRLADLTSYKQDMTYDEEDQLLPIKFDKTGYTNLQWQQTALISYANLALVKNLASNEGDLVDLYTNWRPHAYVIVFDENGGQGESMGEVSAIYDEPVQLPKETFIRKNYLFTGWSTDKNSKKPEFESQESIKNLTSIDGDRVTLYAVWERDRFALELAGE